MKPQTARARRLLPGAAVNYLSPALATVSEQSPASLPHLPPIHLAHTARSIIQKHSSGHELPLLRGLLGLPTASRIMFKLSRPRAGVSTNFNFLLEYNTQAEKSTDHRGNITFSESKRHTPSARLLQIKKHNLTRAPETHHHTSLQVSTPTSPTYTSRSQG